MKRKIVILGISSGIGKSLALQFYKKGFEVIGTYNSKKNLNKVEYQNYNLININALNLKKKGLSELKKKSRRWDILISCFGIIEPVGKIFDLDIKKIKKNFEINFFSNLEILKIILETRNKKSNIFLFSGSGSNGPAAGLSSYTLSKLLLIKLSELISDEYKDINCVTIGPGYIDTKIHQQLIKNKKKAKKAYKKYLSLKQYNDKSDPFKNIYDLILKCIKYPKLTRGRNFSSKYDKWKNNFSQLKKNIILDDNYFKLRRKN